MEFFSSLFSLLPDLSTYTFDCGVDEISVVDRETIEYKYFVKAKDGTLGWQPKGNSSIDIPKTTQGDTVIDVHDNWRGTDRRISTIEGGDRKTEMHCEEDTEADGIEAVVDIGAPNDAPEITDNNGYLAAVTERNMEETWRTEITMQNEGNAGGTQPDAGSL